MPTYVYGCTKHPGQRLETYHSIHEDPVFPCPDCQAPMHRIPQAFRWGHNPYQLLLDKIHDRYIEYRKEKKYGIKRPPKHQRGAPIAD